MGILKQDNADLKHLMTFMLTASYEGILNSPVTEDRTWFIGFSSFYHERELFVWFLRLLYVGEKHLILPKFLLISFSSWNDKTRLELCYWGNRNNFVHFFEHEVGKNRPWCHLVVRCRKFFYQLFKGKRMILARKINRVIFVTYMIKKWWHNPGR